MTIINGTLVDDVGLGSGLSLSGSTLSAEWTAGAVSAIGSGLTLSGGTLSNSAEMVASAYGIVPADWWYIVSTYGSVTIGGASYPATAYSR